MDEIELELCRAKQEWISFDVNNCTLQGFQAKWLTDKGFSRRPEPLVRGTEIDVNTLANEIRIFDGNNDKGAGAIAEHLKANAHVWLKEMGGE